MGGIPILGSIFGGPELSEPKVPEREDPAEKRRKAKRAADRRRKAAIGAFGLQDTNITGGLGPTPTANKAAKPILGA